MNSHPLASPKQTAIASIVSGPTVAVARRRASLAVMALAVAGAAAWLAGAGGARAADAATDVAGPQVPVIEVGPRAVGAGLTLDGSLQAVRQSTLSAQASGRIAQLGIKAGDRVKAGQVLAVVDDRLTQAGVAEAQAGVAQAQAQATNAQAQFDRTKDLQAQGFVAQAALDNAQAQLRSAQAGLSAARAGQTQSTLAQGYTRLTAPYDGWVLETHAEAGDLAVPGKPILTVYAPQPIRAVVYVPASQQALAAKASRIDIQLPNGNSGATGGRWVQPVTRASLPAADPVSQTVEWRLDLSAQDGADLVPGRQVKVRFVVGDAERLVVPEVALLRRGELTGVYVVAPATDGQPARFVLRAVRMGAVHGEAGIEVLAGLRAGDRVALDPVRAGLAGARPE